jgi:hypothetical protein
MILKEKNWVEVRVEVGWVGCMMGGSDENSRGDFHPLKTLIGFSKTAAAKTQGGSEPNHFHPKKIIRYNGLMHLGGPGGSAGRITPGASGPRCRPPHMMYSGSGA